MADTFPRQHARTRRFTLGSPRDLRVSADGRTVAFLRTRAGDDPVTCLWVLEVATGTERVVIDPRALDVGDDPLPAEELARRERAREAAGGIVSYDSDPLLANAVCALGGRLLRADLGTGEIVVVDAESGVFDPRLDPTGQLVAYVHGATLRLAGPDGDRVLVAEADQTTVAWGSAEFVAAEEMGRSRGFWWAPDGRRLLVTRVDSAAVDTWWIADPVTPASPPRSLRYPSAGTANAVVDLAIVDLEGTRRNLDWRRGEWEYLADASWAPRSQITLLVQTRDQRTAAVLVVDPDTGEVDERQRWTDDSWVDLVAGSPTWWDDRLCTVADRGDARVLLVDGEPVTPAGLQVHRIVAAADDGLVLEASADPTECHVVRVDEAGRLTQVTRVPGVHRAAAGGGLVVVSSATMDHDGVSVRCHRDGAEIGVIPDHSAIPLVRPQVRFETVGARDLRVGVMLPTRGSGEGSLPVLLDPYGGPHHARVQRARSAWLTSQWFADQGFAVVVVDGRGTPGRGPVWERAVRHDLAGPVLDDQVDALEALADRYPQLDLDRVGIRGWSFGGYLAALAVLRRPDVFHAAIAGAPVTDWRLYDTHYTERYLGLPEEHADAYQRSSLLDEAGSLRRPLLLIHGLADDNVVAAHTLALSRALLEAGRPHQVLPLSGVTHMTPQEVVAENLLLLQLEFLHASL